MKVVVGYKTKSVTQTKQPKKGKEKKKTHVNFKLKTSTGF